LKLSALRCGLMIHPLTLGDIRRIVNDRVQETTSLEFKRQLPKPKQNDDMAKLIAALSNTAGGAIIYGIEEDADSRAKLLAPIELSGCTERITQVAGTIDEPITPLSVYTVGNSPGYGYAVVELALSARAPHFHKGVAYGRTPKTTTILSRRQVGALFAQSDGFVHEFGLQTTKPGRLLVRGRRAGRTAFVSFSNDGESDITDVDWRNAATSGLIHSTASWPFPIHTLRPGSEVSHYVALSSASGPFQVQASWYASDGQLHEEEWPLTF